MRPIRRTASDATQKTIVDALRVAGWKCWVIGWPADLLVWKQGKGFRLLEAKTPNRKDGGYTPRKDQAEQEEFLRLTGTPRVTSAEAALRAVGL
jgi:hypothetical protein